MESTRVKVLLREEEYVETLWAERVGPDPYQLDNSPSWAYGVSWLDVVEAHPDKDGQLAFTRVIETSGHRTVRVIFAPGIDANPEGQAIVDELVRLGCTYEGMNPGYIAIDLPPGVELTMVAGYLTGQGARWEYADPRYSQLYRDEES
jgi:hypothetical protein